MAASQELAASEVGGQNTGTPIELAVKLTQSPGLLVNIHLTILTQTIILFLTTSSPESEGNAAMGSFVYAMPDVRIPSHKSPYTNLTKARNTIQPNP